LHYDPPEHTVYRKAINPTFRKDRLGRLEPVVKRLAAEMLSGLAAERDETTLDLYGRFCSPFAGRVVCALLNIDDRYVDDLSAGMERFEAAQRARDGAAVERHNIELYGMCRELVEGRLGSPLLPEEDLISALLALKEPPDTETVTGSLRQIIVAGHGAPALVIASAVAHLAEDDALQHEWRRRPELVAAGAEEMLRLHTPNVGFARMATRPVSLGGRQIEEGEMVAIVLPSANRDEDVFDRPDEVILGRPERHLAFGHGVHVCPGSVVGRSEVVVAIQALLGSTASFEPAGDAVYSPWPTAGPTRLPLRLVWRRDGVGPIGPSLAGHRA
jgi:cytochrome P450